MGNTILKECRMEGVQRDVSISGYHPTMIQDRGVIRSNNKKHINENNNNHHNHHNQYQSYHQTKSQSQSQNKFTSNQHSQSTQQQSSPNITLPINFIPSRSNQMQTIYQSLIQQSTHPSLYRIEPIQYSIQNQWCLQQFGVSSLIQLCEKLSKCQQRDDSNFIVMRYDYLQLQVGDDSILIDKTAYRQRAISRGSSNRSSNKQILINSTILTNNQQQPPTPSLYNPQQFCFTHKKCIYIGYVNTENIPHGSGQLYCFNQQNTHTNNNNIDYSFANYHDEKNNLKDNAQLEMFVQAQFDNGLIATSDCVIINRNGSYYRGGFVGQVIHGRGRVCQRDGLILQGNFANGLLQGKGNAVYPDHGSYLGYFHQGLRQGKGMMTWKSQQPNTTLTIIYDGYFKSDQMQGLGYLKTPNYEYWGPFVFNMKQGKGTLKFTDGRKYEGWFQQDQISGYGELHYPDGYVQKGTFPLKEQ